MVSARKVVPPHSVRREGWPAACPARSISRATLIWLTCSPRAARAQTASATQRLGAEKSAGLTTSMHSFIASTSIIQHAITHCSASSSTRAEAAYSAGLM